MKIAVLGYGTVGKSLCDILDSHDTGIEVKYILRRKGKADGERMTDSIEEILSDPEVEAVADVLPGTEPSLSYMKKALLSKKHVVTANKAALCEGFRELKMLSDEKGLALFYEASCGGTIPVIEAVRKLSAVNEISGLRGILNGTCNYMLDQMTKKGTEFAEALLEAQRLGYAEADPTADISGYDVRNKAVILSQTALHAYLGKDIPMSGIEQVEAEHIRRFLEEGKCVRLTAQLRREGKRYAMGVVPTLVEQHSLFGQVPDNFNMVSVTASLAGEIALYGQGAGGVPTADALLRDLLKIKNKEDVGVTRPYQEDFVYDESLLRGTGYLGTDCIGSTSLAALLREAKKAGRQAYFIPET